ncbi:MAG: YecA family protein [Verrucomicrobia bacterium]|nr:YecA family protein [Verrucomicrobiota bacterium]
MTRYEAFVGKNFRESGMTQVVVARFRANGLGDMGFFLLDLWCLGVKDAFLLEDLSESEFRDIIRDKLPEDARERLHPACARKLIDGAVAYAQKLGFDPHRDFRKARRTLSGLEARDCPETFTYGKDGKPMFVEGPDDAGERRERVLAILRARLGEDGFHYAVTADGFGEDDDLVAAEPGEEEMEEMEEAAREELMAFFENEPESAPTFYEFAGMVAGMLTCPTLLMPTKLLEKLWGPPGREWRNPEEAQQFIGNLALYWNSISLSIQVCADPEDDDPELNPIDVFPDEVEDEKHETEALADWAHGFMRATEEWPEAWGDALKRADLATHWYLLQAWREPRRLASTAVRALYRPPGPKVARERHLPLAVIALIRALRSGPPEATGASDPG